MFFPISSYKLFNQFFIVPEFLKTLSLSSSYQLFYGEVSKLINHPQNRSKGFVEISREDLAAILQCSTRTIDRMISISKLNGLMLITTNGRNLLISICYHPAMPISEDQAKKCEVKLPFSSTKTATQLRQKRRISKGSHDHDHVEKEYREEKSSKQAAAITLSSVNSVQTEETKNKPSFNLLPSNNCTPKPIPNCPNHNIPTNESPNLVSKPTSGKYFPARKMIQKSKFTMDQIRQYALNELQNFCTLTNVEGFIKARYIDGLDDAKIEQYFSQPTHNSCLPNNRSNLSNKKYKNLDPDTYVGQYNPTPPLSDYEVKKKLEEIEKMQADLENPSEVDSKMKDTLADVLKSIKRELRGVKPAQCISYMLMVKSKLHCLNVAVPSQVLSDAVTKFWVSWI